MAAALVLAFVLMVSPGSLALADAPGTSDSGAGWGYMWFGNGWQWDSCDANGWASSNFDGFSPASPIGSLPSDEDHTVSIFSQSGVVASGQTSEMYLCGNVRGSCLGLQGLDLMGRLDTVDQIVGGGTRTIHYLTGLAWDRLPAYGTVAAIHMTGRYEAVRDGVTIGTGAVIIDMSTQNASTFPEFLSCVYSDWSYASFQYTVQLIDDETLEPVPDV